MPDKKEVIKNYITAAATNKYSIASYVQNEITLVTYWEIYGFNVSFPKKTGARKRRLTDFIKDMSVKYNRLNAQQQEQINFQDFVFQNIHILEGATIEYTHPIQSIAPFIHYEEEDYETLMGIFDEYNSNLFQILDYHYLAQR